MISSLLTFVAAVLPSLQLAVPGLTAHTEERPVSYFKAPHTPNETVLLPTRDGNIMFRVHEVEILMPGALHRPDGNGGLVPYEVDLDVRFFRGTSLGGGDLTTAICVKADGMHGMVYDSTSGEMLDFEPVTVAGMSVFPTGRRLPYQARVVSASSELSADAACDLLPHDSFNSEASLHGTTPPSFPLVGNRICELGLDLTHGGILTMGGGNVAVALGELFAMINEASTIYESSFNVTFVVSALIVRDFALFDPYLNNLPSFPHSNQARAMVVSEWKKLGGQLSYDVIGGLGHFNNMSHAGYASGIGDLGSCFPSFVSKVQMDNANRTTLRIFSHEIGHLFGACHCQEVSACAPVSGDCSLMCSTLFSACSPVPGDPLFLAFGTSSMLSIGNHLASEGDIFFSDPEAPHLNTVTPLVVEIGDRNANIEVLGTDLEFADWAFLDFPNGPVPIGFASIRRCDFIVHESDRVVFRAPAFPSVIGRTQLTLPQRLPGSNELTMLYVSPALPKMEIPTFWNFNRVLELEGVSEPGQFGHFRFSVGSSATISIAGHMVLDTPFTTATKALDSIGVLHDNHQVNHGSIGQFLWVQFVATDASGAILEVGGVSGGIPYIPSDG